MSTAMLERQLKVFRRAYVPRPLCERLRSDGRTKEYIRILHLAATTMQSRRWRRSSAPSGGSRD